MTLDDAALAALFAAGPDGFIGERLARYLALTQPEAAAQREAVAAAADVGRGDETSAVPPAEPPAVPPDEPPAAHRDAVGPDAWQADAMRRVARLWSGTPADVEHHWGAPAPPELAAFWELTRGYDLWSSFTELRLDASLLGRFDDSVNVFELCVLNDQLNYLGTALPEAFSAAVCFATYGDGDSWHIDVNPTDKDDPHHVVTRYSHDDHHFEHEPVANSLHDAVFLSAVVHAFRQEWLSKAQAKEALSSLHGRVAPSWHFSLEDIDKGFVPSNAPQAATAAYMAVRSTWIFKVLGADLVSGLETLPRAFAAQLNAIITPELLVGRLKSVERLVPTALYAMWRAYLFDEPELEQYLALGRRHRGRLARDAARLIDELRAGREVLGKHTRWSERLAQVRAADLDPRRAVAREAEAAAAAARVEAERAETLAALSAVDDDGLAAFIAARAETGVLEAMRARVTTLLPPRAQHALDVTMRAVHDRDGRSYSDEADEVVAVLGAESAHPALQAWALALVDHGEGTSKPPPFVGAKLLAAWGARGVVTEAVGLGLVERARRLTTDETRHGLKHTLELLAKQPWPAAVTTSLVAFFEAWLPTLPAEGGFDTSLHFDELNGQAALTAGTLLRAAPHEVRSGVALALLPMASTTSARMRHTRVQGALGLALLDPTAFSDDVFAALLSHMEQVNSHEEGSEACLAIAVAAKGQSPATAQAWAARLRASKPYAASSVELQALRAVALHALGAASDAEVDDALRQLATASAWKEEYVLKRHQLIRRVFALLPDRTPTAKLLEVLAQSAHDGVATWAAHTLRERGVAAASPRRITWLDVERATDAQRLAFLADASLAGRHHAARALVPAPRDVDAPDIRAALETAVQQAAAAAPKTHGLSRAEDRLLTEAVWALLRLPLSPSTVAVGAALLLHENREVKDPLLRAPPNDPALEAGMRHVLAENYGWQASTAKSWLQARGLLPPDASDDE